MLTLKVTRTFITTYKMVVIKTHTTNAKMTSKWIIYKKCYLIFFWDELFKEKM